MVPRQKLYQVVFILFTFLFFILFTNSKLQAQTKSGDTPPTTPAATPTLQFKAPDPITPAIGSSAEQEERIPNGNRIRRQLNLIVGIEHDEELLIPDKAITVGGRSEFLDISRIAGTDYFRITPKKSGNGITTLKDAKTGQILVELRFDIRDDTIEKTMREVQTMLADIEGIEYKIVNGLIYIDGYVLLPRDLVRIAQVITMWPGTVKSLATLSPIARKKIADFISNDINNPEVKITAVGDYLKLEGQVNSQAEKDRIKEIVKLYVPDIVTELAPNQEHIKISGRKNNTLESMIIDLITVIKDEERTEPPPKMIQIVAHFVKFGDTYGKSFNFRFSPALSAQTSTQAPSNSTIDSTVNILNNLLPKLNWAKVHGYAKILDTASILIQDKVSGSITRNVFSPTSTAPIVVQGQTAFQQPTISAQLSLGVQPTIKSERSGLIELKDLNVTIKSGGGKVESQSETQVKTTISVRDRQSAAFGGVIKKSTETSFGAPASENAIITFNAEKSYNRNDSQFVVFITPIIKSSASAGVEQVKKKFRMRD